MTAKREMNITEFFDYLYSPQGQADLLGKVIEAGRKEAAMSNNPPYKDDWTWEQNRDQSNEQNTQDTVTANNVDKPGRVRAALRDLLALGKRDLSNPKYDAYFDEARAALREYDPQAQRIADLTLANNQMQTALIDMREEATLLKNALYGLRREFNAARNRTITVSVSYMEWLNKLNLD